MLVDKISAKMDGYGLFLAQKYILGNGFAGYTFLTVYGIINLGLRSYSEAKIKD